MKSTDIDRIPALHIFEAKYVCSKTLVVIVGEFHSSIDDNYNYCCRKLYSNRLYYFLYNVVMRTK